MIKIEKGVPLPKLYGNAKAATDVANAYNIGSTLYNKMEVGDSAVIDGISPKQLQTRFNRINQALGFDKLFTTRKEGDGFRVWRIK